MNNNLWDKRVKAKKVQEIKEKRQEEKISKCRKEKKTGRSLREKLRKWLKEFSLSRF